MKESGWIEILLFVKTKISLTTVNGQIYSLDGQKEARVENLFKW